MLTDCELRGMLKEAGGDALRCFTGIFVEGLRDITTCLKMACLQMGLNWARP